MNDKIIIVGAGLTGSLLALYLGKKGIQVDVFDKRCDIRDFVPTKKRSLGMSLSTRGRLALQKAGIMHRLAPTTMPKYGRATHAIDGSIKYQMYGDGSQYLSTVNRKTVNSLLIAGAQETGMVRFHFEEKLTAADLEAKKLTFVNTQSGQESVQEYTHVLGTDGANSNLRSLLCERDILDYQRTKMNHFFKEMAIPPTDEGEFALNPEYVHIWSTPDAVFVALPNIDKSFVSTLFYSNKEDGILNKVVDVEGMRQYLDTYLPHLSSISPKFAEDFFSNPASDIYEVKCNNWKYKNEVMLIGDSAHAFAPFYAMGMNTCFEDCQLFIESLERYSFNFGNAIEDFCKNRKKDVDAMQFLTNRNYFNLQFSSKEGFDIKWKIERKLWNKYPDVLMPEYLMVAFTQIPFAEVVAIAERNKAIVEELYERYQSLLRTNNRLGIKEFIELPEVRSMLAGRTSLMSPRKEMAYARQFSGY
ncbi:MAG: NAD(P)/FAD-dependent oxidoreductase [Bacteroidota bacterium]